MPMKPKEKPVCPYCASAEIIGTGSLTWNMVTQKWDSLGHCYDDFICASCDEEFKYPNWVEVLIDETE